MTDIHYLRAAGVGVVVDARGPATPRIAHWGRDLGPLTDGDLRALAETTIPAVGPSSIDVPQLLTLVPTRAEGWTGRPGVAGTRPGEGPRGAAAWPSLHLVDVETDTTGLVVTLRDDDAALTITRRIGLTDAGLLVNDIAVTNTGSDPFALDTAPIVLPVPARATQVLDFTGRWPLERVPQRLDLPHGTWSREHRHGRPGHDAAFLLTVGTPGFSFRSGEVWATALAWSGDGVLWAERSATGLSHVGAGELPAPQEVVLAAGETYRSPRVLSAWSDAGLDGTTARFHSHVRSEARHRWGGLPPRPRPVVLNTWEAVYFDHSRERLRALAETAAAIGVERFVLDDGWFTGRRSDRSSLGDWTVDPDVWPEGLGPIIDDVRGLGMEFGLWVEPEMISLDSRVAREHPDWVLRTVPGRDPLPWRHQHVLDLTNPAAFAHVRDALTGLLDRYDIAFLKWDHNRDVVEGPSRDQTLATYRLLDDLHEGFPDLEIESCASGGARVDLGIVGRVDRFWPSDTNDALERQRIQRWTGLLFPPEYLGSHVGAGTAHTTGRRHALGFRLATALMGHAGLEWDLTEASPAELERLTEWIAFYRRTRHVLHSGQTVRLDTDESTWVHGVVDPDRAEAVFVLATMGAHVEAMRPPLRLAGLDPRAEYRVEIVDFGRAPLAIQDAPPPWWTLGETRTRGSVLMDVGLAVPALAPENAVVFHVTRWDGATATPPVR